jgi:hypothetical protein
MQQCMGAAERVLSIHQPPPPNYFNLKRKSLEAGEQPLKRQAAVAPIESAHPPRNIQPRPISSNFTPAPLNMSSSPNTPGTVLVTGKKRGSPSKADKEAQARANSFRTLEYAPITPAPAPAPPAAINIAPQREYISSPSYEVTSNTSDVKGRKRGKLSGNENSPTAGYYPLASPASVPDTRGPPEPIDQSSRTESPRDHGGSQPADPRPSSFHQPRQHPSPSPGQSHTAPLQLPNTLPPIQSGSCPPNEQYRPEQPRVVDPIFPDRDRSRASFDPMTRATPPAPPLTNRG